MDENEKDEMPEGQEPPSEPRPSALAAYVPGPPVEQRMEELLAMIREGESLEFLELFAALETKAEMIVTFLALLELVRLKRVRVYQRGMFGPIRVFRPVGPPAEGAPVPVPAS